MEYKGQIPWSRSFPISCTKRNEKEFTPKDCKRSLDAGAAGVIIPMVESAEELAYIMEHCSWPPMGKRGVGFSSLRAGTKPILGTQRFLSATDFKVGGPKGSWSLKLAHWPEAHFRYTTIP